MKVQLYYCFVVRWLSLILLTTTLSSAFDIDCDPCIDRQKLTIGVVTHAIATDRFWDPVFKGAHQASLEMGVQLSMEIFEPQDSDAVIYQMMVDRMETLCTDTDNGNTNNSNSVVDALLVTLPSEAVRSGVQSCLEADIPVIVMNAGPDLSKELELQFVGQVEYQVGFEAGQRLVEACPTCTSFYCLNHAEGVNVVEERCSGLKVAVMEALSNSTTSDNTNMVVVEQVYVDPNDKELYKQTVEAAVGEDGDWETIALFLAGEPNHVPALYTQESHPNVTMGAVDVSEALFTALGDGNIQFGADQQPYLQGHHPVVFLTLLASTKLGLVSDLLETGPNFIESPPTDAEVVCQEDAYEVCVVTPSIPAEETPKEGDEETSMATCMCCWHGLLAYFAVVMMAVY